MALTEITSKGIKDATIVEADLANGAVTAALIADGTITNSEISNSAAIDASKISGLATDSITEGNTKVEVVDAQGNNSYGVIKFDLGATDNSGSSSTESNYLHSTRTGNNYLTEINQAHGGSDNSLRLNVGSTGGTGSFIVEKGPTNGVNTGIFSYQASSGGGAWTLTTGGTNNSQVVNFTTTQAYILPRTSIVPNTDSAIDLGLDGSRWRNAYVDTYYGDGSNLTGISSDLVADTSPQLGGALDTNEHNIAFGDSSGTGNDRLKFGDSGDLQIYHDGNQSYVYDSGTGDLNLQTNGTKIKLGKDDGASCGVFIPDAAVELYHNNSKRLETTTTGWKSQKAGSAECIIGSTDGGGAYLYLDGDANGDASGSDYAYIGMTNSGVFRIWNHKNEDIEFANNNGVRAKINTSGHFVPGANNTYDLGTSSYRWRNIYTNDLNLSNEGSSNDVDGSWGDWTIQEGASDLFLKNNRSGKKYKFNLTEVS